MPLSQIHYHFGTKKKMVLAILTRQNEELLQRQEAMFHTENPLWMRWEKACDYLDDDLESGYVRVLQEMMAAGWSDPEIAGEVRGLLTGWIKLLKGVIEASESAFSGFAPFNSTELASMVGILFLGVESGILLGLESQEKPLRNALRKIGYVIRIAEERPS